MENCRANKLFKILQNLKTTERNRESKKERSNIKKGKRKRYFLKTNRENRKLGRKSPKERKIEKANYQTKLEGKNLPLLTCFPNWDVRKLFHWKSTDKKIIVSCYERCYKRERKIVVKQAGFKTGGGETGSRCVGTCMYHGLLVHAGMSVWMIGTYCTYPNLV